MLGELREEERGGRNAMRVKKKMEEERGEGWMLGE